MPANNLRAEVLVIGSGPGGATTAHVLAEGGKDVLILEEGPDLSPDSCAPFSVEEMRQKYRAGGLNPAFGAGKVAMVEGRCAGGGSEINSALYHRTPADILDHWRQTFKVQNTRECDLLPHFQYCEEALRVGTSPTQTPLASRKLHHGAQQLAWHSLEVPRCFKYSDTPEASGAVTGTRQSMTRTFLPRARQAGARLMPLTRANRLRRSGSGWVASASTAGNPVEIHADTVFVCGGAIQTPLLLRRSGFTSNVGDTLALHPTVKAVALFDEEVNHESMGVPVHQVKEFSPRMSFGCSISSPPYLALALAGYRPSEIALKERWRNMAIYYGMIAGPNSGSVRPVLNLRDPLIRYGLSAIDLRDLATALRRLCRILLAAGARKVYPCIDGARAISSEDELSSVPSMLSPDRSNLMTIHLFSSCPMGEDPALCAVDSMGRVHGASNLIVNDASLICTAPGVNPQGTVTALAHRNAMHFLGRL
jgi:choline dehydrogenase-like flavoprotein